MSTTGMPKGITQGYSSSFRAMLAAIPASKVLSIQDLKDLDDAGLKAVIEPENPVKLPDEDQAA